MKKQNKRSVKTVEQFTKEVLSCKEYNHYGIGELKQLIQKEIKL